MSSTIPNRTRLALVAAAAGLALATAGGSPARAMVGHDYDAERAPIATTWYRAADPAALQADRDYVVGMRAHHAGALTMSEAYLADPQASSPVLKALAQAIIPNQRYEIGLLDEVARNLDRPPVVIDLGLFRLALQPAAAEGLAQTQRFIKTPIPGQLAALAGRGAPVTERDVQFAKAMTIHHQGALDMARAYNADSNARNQFLRLLNVDILTDQSQEIALMRSVIAAYPGDPDAVAVPASMVHGMEGMGHGGGHAGQGGHTGHGAAESTATAEAAPAAPPPASAPWARQARPQPRPEARPAHAAPQHHRTTPEPHQGHSGHTH
jgi:uncharacterized protein (DUF305 family)